MFVWGSCKNRSRVWKPSLHIWRTAILQGVWCDQSPAWSRSHKEVFPININGNNPEGKEEMQRSISSLREYTKLILSSNIDSVYPINKMRNYPNNSYSLPTQRSAWPVVICISLDIRALAPRLDNGFHSPLHCSHRPRRSALKKPRTNFSHWPCFQ